MNATQRSEYWTRMERMRKQFDDKYSSLFYEAIKSDLEMFAKDVIDKGPSAALSMLGAYAWNEEMMTIMRMLYRDAAISFGNASYRAVGVMSRKAANPFGLNQSLIKEITAYLTQYGFYLIANITQTTKKKLNDLVTNAVNQGMTIQDIAKLITNDDQLSYGKTRARVISRTEVMRSSNYAALIGAAKHPFEVDKVWISRRDNRTRRIPPGVYDHVDMDGQTVAYNEKFKSRDAYGRLIEAEIPGDPITPAGFTINCRCTIGFVPKRDANGNLIMKQ